MTSENPEEYGCIGDMNPFKNLAHLSLVMPYGDRDLGQHWLM